MRKLLFIVFTVLFLMLVGCSNSSDTKTQSSSSSQFVGGTEGLTLSFATGSLPASIFDKDESFGVSILLENKGEHTIKTTSAATVTLSGFDPKDFGASSSDLKQDISNSMRGTSKDSAGNTVKGETVSLDFPKSGSSFAHQKEIAGSVDYTFRAGVCYLYQNIANVKLCVLEDMLGTKSKDNKLCKVSEDKSASLANSGGPVQITSFKEAVSSKNKVSFVFTVEHKGKGKVFEKTSKCDSSYQKKDRVYLTIDTGMSDGLQCSGMQKGAASGSKFSGSVQLLNNKREVRCTQTINTPADLEKLVTITMDYDYESFASQKLTVKHIGS